MERYFIIGEKNQCSFCFVFFPSADAVKKDSHVYCSEACEQVAAEESCLAAVEFEHTMEAA